ncbi:MAG: 2-aminoadipate transaminase [Actinomycetota bacterium]|nr:2-aminoadipate transaminase [Actinomycetota bacterium]
MTPVNSPAAMPRGGSRLDPWVDSYAARSAGLTASEIRALFAVASRPEVVSLAGGMPFVSALPLDILADTVAAMIRDRGAVALQYGSGQGDEHLREQICEVMQLSGINGHPDDVVVTTGSQMALDLVVRIFCDPGDVVLVESPSYVGALGVFRSYQCRIVHVQMDDDGLSPAALTETIDRLTEQGARIKLLYTVPTYQNPSGITASPDRRAEMLQIAARHNILVLEDDPYCLLGFDGHVPQAIRALDDQAVVYLGSFSKTIAAGLRVGWALAPHGVREKLVLAAEAAVLCPANYAQLTVAEYLDTQPWLDQVKVFRELYRERRDALLGAMAAQFPAGTTWTVPEGGFYSWVTLPEGLDATAMLPRAVSSLVAYVPGTGFYSDGQGRESLRLSYCYPEPERIVEGVRRLAGVIESELDVAHTFGTDHVQPPPGPAFPDPGMS